MTVKPGRYRHYKGRDYQVLSIARHSESEEELVVYRCLYGDFCLWVRPLAMFVEEVAVDGRRVPRFSYIGSEVPEIIDPTRLTVVLCEPQHPGNVGATARAMANFGVVDLRLVNPCQYLHPEARKLAAHGWPLLGSATVYRDLDAALTDCSLSIATTRRSGRGRKELLDCSELLPLLGTLPPPGRAALVFGREDSGLTSAEVSNCSHAATITTSTPGEGGSLNLSQAVVILLYELLGRHSSVRATSPQR